MRVEVRALEFPASNPSKKAFIDPFLPPGRSHAVTFECRALLEAIVTYCTFSLQPVFVWNEEKKKISLATREDEYKYHFCRHRHTNGVVRRRGGVARRCSSKQFKWSQRLRAHSWEFHASCKTNEGRAALNGRRRRKETPSLSMECVPFAIEQDWI